MRLCGMDIDICFEDRSLWAQNGMGRSSTLDGKILVRNDMPITVQHSVLIHEIVHFIADSNNIDLSEGAVNVLAINIHAALRDNPQIFAQIMAAGSIMRG